MKAAKSIRFKIISISILTLLIALTLTSVLNYYQSRRDLTNYMERTISSLASSIASEVSLWLESCKVEVSASALALADLDSQEQRLAFMHKIIENSTIYETMFLADAAGDYYITEGEAGNIADRPYFREVMSGHTVVADPVISRATGRSVLVVAAPLLENGTPAGLVGLTVSLEDLSESIVTRQIGATGYPYIVQGDGLVIAHPDQSLVLSLNTITDESLDQNLRGAMQDVTAGNNGVSRYIFEGIDKYVAYAPVPLLSWAVAITVPVFELHEQLSSLPVTIFLLTAGIALLAIFVSNAFLTRKVTNPLQEMQEMIARAAQGDLTLRGQVTADDEIGRLTADFNSFLDRIQALIENIQSNSADFNQSLQDMFAITQSMLQSSEEMNNKTQAVNEAVQQISKSIEGTASASSEASDSINIIASAVEEMHSNIQHQASAARQISTNLEQVSLGVNQVSTSINDISYSAQDMSSSVNSVATAVKEINISLNEVSVSCERSTQITDDAENKARETRVIIENLNQSSRQIGRIISVINDIADQTNMLALNAAIEAAGAGEAGRGFAVVANEVKELAKQTAEATEEIGQQIEDMQTNMQDAVQAMETITGVIEESNSITGTIASAVAQQSAATEEISSSIIKAAEKVNQITSNIAGVASSTQQAAGNITEVSSGLSEIAHSTNELAQGANEVAENAVKASGKVARVADESAGISRGAQEIAASIEEISQESTAEMVVVTEISDSAQKLADLFSSLEAMSKQFKV